MLYIKRDAWGNLQQVEAAPFEGMDGELAADSQEAQAWYANQAVESSLLQLKQSDLDMIRVLEDLITVLIRNGVVRITDLPEAAQTWFKQDLNPATSAYVSVVVCLALFTAARVCEQVRTGIQALPRGQSAAALAVGFSIGQTYRHVLLPQAFRIIIPPLTSEFLNIFKNSSVASLIGLMELLAQTKQTAEFSANIFEAFTLATVIYFVLNMSLMTLMSLVEKKVRIPGMMGGAK